MSVRALRCHKRAITSGILGLALAAASCGSSSTDVRDGRYVVYVHGGGVAPSDLAAQLTGSELTLAAGGESAVYQLAESEARFQVCASNEDEQAVLLLDPPSVLLPGMGMERAGLHGPCVDGDPYLIHLVDLAVTDVSSPLQFPNSVALCEEASTGCPLQPVQTTGG
jgi:hypothetical protein